MTKSESTLIGISFFHFVILCHSIIHRAILSCTRPNYQMHCVREKIIDA